MNTIPTKSSIEEAHKRIAHLIHRTPIHTSESINLKLGMQIYFKTENLQKVGAFKARGALNAILSLKEKGDLAAVGTHSSGNHAQAVALAAKMTGTKAYIVMPSTAPSVKKAAVIEYGGEVIECEPTLEARESTLKDVIDRTGAIEVHPYNNYMVIEGQATAAKELMEDIDESLDYIITPVGGGGLLSGTILSCRYFSPTTHVYAGEPEGADDAFRSVEKGAIVPSINPDTIADGLLTSLGEKNFEIILGGVKEIITVSDSEILEAMTFIWERMKLVVEPSGAVPLAALSKRPELFKNKRVGLIISGGNVDVSKMIAGYYS